MLHIIFTGTLSGLRKRLQNCLVISMCQPKRRASLFIAILLGLSSNLCFVTDAAPLILFEDSEFRGAKIEYLLDASETCVNIRGKLNDIFSSVQNTESESCILLCEHEFCRGQCIRIIGSITDLESLDFNDMVSSIKRCHLDPSRPTESNQDSTTSITASTSANSEIHGSHIETTPQLPQQSNIINSTPPNSELEEHEDHSSSSSQQIATTSPETITTTSSSSE